MQKITNDGGADPAGWGSVPTVNNDLATAVPPTPATPSVVQTAQSDNAATIAAAQLSFLPPAPTWNMPDGSVGNWTPTWITWFNSLARRLGGYTASPTDDAVVLAYEPESVDSQARLLVQALQSDSGTDVVRPIPAIEADLFPVSTPSVILPSELDMFGSPQPQLTIPNPELWDPGRTGQWVDQLNPVLPKTSGKGIRVDLVTPTFPWRDCLGDMRPDPGGVNSPTLAVWRGGAGRQYFYSANDKMDFQFHVPHDYVPGSDLFIHIHWGHNGTAISGNFTASIATSYAKGHNQAIWPAEKTVTVTYATVNIATTPQYIHRIDEVQWASAGGSASLFDTALVEPDGLILGVMTMTAIPTITGGSTNEPFIAYIDLHYQSTSMGTKQKSPNFYV